jgi:hypothetical protein
MSCLRSVRGCARLDHIMNEDIIKELKVQSTEDKTSYQRQNWVNHLDKIIN